MSTKAEIAISYSVDNEFFRLWLDESMSYSGAVWDDADSLEQAQRNKLRILADYAGVAPSQTVLDIGCGWGAMLAYLVSERRVEAAHGITLSDAQLAEIERRKLPRAKAWCKSYLELEPSVRYDAVISIGMFEHAATPAQARAGEHLDVYREFFRRAHTWTRPGARFGLQTIVRTQVPRDRQDLRDTAWFMDTIFPGSMPPRIEDVVLTVAPCWEILEMRTRRLDYARTCAEWLARLRKHETHIRARFGDRRFEEYERYLTICVHGFSVGYYSLTQWSLARTDRNEKGFPR